MGPLAGQLGGWRAPWWIRQLAPAPGLGEEVERGRRCRELHDVPRVSFNGWPPKMGRGEARGERGDAGRGREDNRWPLCLFCRWGFWINCSLWSPLPSPRSFSSGGRDEQQNVGNVEESHQSVWIPFKMHLFCLHLGLRCFPPVILKLSNNTSRLRKPALTL